MNIRIILASALISFFPLAASAHVRVVPAEAGVGTFQTFTMSVPSEKPMATISLRLVLPAGLQYVSPTVKPGWRIETKKDAEGNVTEILWTGGSIPAERRDDFTFSARVPSTEAKLVWKAYQSYADGTVVAWDMDPTHEHDDDSATSGPFSETRVINDLSGAPGYTNMRASELASFVLAAAALVTAGLALARTRKRHHSTHHVA